LTSPAGTQRGKKRPAGRGPFGVPDQSDRKNPLYLASGLAIAVAVVLTGTLAWLMMRPPAIDAEAALVRSDAPAVQAAPAPVETAAAPPVSAPPAAATPAAAPALAFTGQGGDVTAALPPAEVLREVAVGGPVTATQPDSAPAAAAPHPTPAPRTDASEVAVNTPPAKPAEAAPKPEPAAAADPSMEEAIIRRGVNMRASAKSGSRVIAVIPANTRVSADLPCQHWCAISYKGQRGYVYRDFLGVPERKASQE
jgi:hypothetical protein